MRDIFTRDDRALIELLQRDGRQSAAAIARVLELPVSTVRRRISRLLASGALKVVAIADNDRIGLPVHVVLGVQVDMAMRESVGRALVEVEDVRWVAMVAGHYDYLIEAYLASQDHFHYLLTHTLARIPGIRHAEALTVVRQLKDSYAWANFQTAPHGNGREQSAAGGVIQSPVGLDNTCGKATTT